MAVAAAGAGKGAGGRLNQKAVIIAAIDDRVVPHQPELRKGPPLGVVERDRLGRG